MSAHSAEALASSASVLTSKPVKLLLMMSVLSVSTV